MKSNDYERLRRMSEQPGTQVPLTATHVIEYAYRRSVGPVLGAFFSGLQSGKLLGAKTREGRVLCPPAEYDPDTGEATGALVEVGPGGTVASWTWVSEPQSRHVLSKPFAFALIQIDGADTELLHVVDAGSEEAMSTGMRVAPRFRADPQGGIGDLECFTPEGS
jgi:uncharacterized OB-fold protein